MLDTRLSNGTRIQAVQGAYGCYQKFHKNKNHPTALHCTALNCTELHFTALHFTALHYTALQGEGPREQERAYRGLGLAQRRLGNLQEALVRKLNSTLSLHHTILD